MHVRFVEPQQMPEVPCLETASSRKIKTLTFVDKSQEKRNFVCPVCKRTFKRSEHCARHQRAHTKERPFPCQFCHRRYARRDLVVRHVRAVHPHESSDVTPRVSVPSVSSTSGSTNDDDDDDDHLRTGRNTTTEGSVEISRQQQASTRLVSEQTSITSLLIESPHATSGSTVQEHEDVNHHIRRENFLGSFHPENGVHAFKRAGRNSLGEFDLLMSNLQTTDQSSSSLDIFDELNFFDPYNGTSPLPNTTLSPTAQTNLQEINHTPLLRSFNGPMPTIFQLSGQQQQQQQQPRGTQIANVASAVPLLSPVTDPISIPTSSNLSDSYTCSPKSSELPGTSRKLRIAPLTDTHRNKIVQECETSVVHPDDTKHITLPSTNTLNQLLGTFVDVFLSHLPVIHLPTFDLDNTPTPLILSMCAIGALYRLERKMSLDLYLQSDRLLLQEWHKLAQREEALESVFSNYEKSRHHGPEPRQCSSPLLWMVQCRVLLTWFASFTGNPTLVRKGIKDVNILVNEYHNRKRRLGPKRLSTSCSWYEWCERESEKRLLHSIFVLCSLVTAAYDVPPSLAVLQDGEVELPSDDKLWVAPSEVEWQQCIAQTKCAIATSILEGVSHFMDTTTTTAATETQQIDAGSGLSSSWSPFAVMIILHGISIQFWHMAQYTELAISQQNQNSSLSITTSTPPSLEIFLHQQNDKILDRCREQIPQQTNGPSNDGLWDETEGPLSFDCLCILRLIYLRAFTGANPIDKGILLTSDPTEVTEALQKFMSTPQARNLYVTKTAGQALEGIKTPSQVGWKLIQKTVGFKWSVDVAVFYWAFGLFFVKWIHTIDKLIKRQHQRQHHNHNRDCHDGTVPPDGIIDQAEASIFEETRKTFLENDLMTTTTTTTTAPVDYDINNDSDDTNKNKSSLAAQVSRHLAVYFTDTWSWGITARFGYILRKLADICERDFNNNHQ